MNLNHLFKAFLIVIAALVATVAAMAYGTAYTNEYGQPRFGAYTTVYPYAYGTMDYISPPIALTRYGAQYSLSNVRMPVYPQYPVTYLPTMQRPYFGYPYGFDQSASIYNYRSVGGMGGFNYRRW